MNLRYGKNYPLSQKLNHLSLEEIAEEILSSLEFYNKTRLKGNVLESEIRFETILNIASNLGTLSYDIYDFKYSNNIDKYMESSQLSVYKYYAEKLLGVKVKHLYFVFLPEYSLHFLNLTK